MTHREHQILMAQIVWDEAQLRSDFWPHTTSAGYAAHVAHNREVSRKLAKCREAAHMLKLMEVRS